MKLRFEYETIDGDFMYDIMFGNKKIGEVAIQNNLDCYVVAIQAYTDFFLINRQTHIDRKIDLLFRDILAEVYIRLDYESKPTLLLEDECIANRYAINNDLQRVPRYCGFYLIKN